MLLSTTRFALSKRSSCNIIVNALSKHFSRQTNARCRSNVVGYFTVYSKCFSGHKSVINRPSVITFSSDSNSTYSVKQELTTLQFEKISDDTLESLTEYFDELVEHAAHLPDADVSYRDGVLTVKFGDSHGTYVINRQTPNKQIWLSSPKTGPKRYDFINGKWIYKHDGKTLHELLNNEIPAIIRNQACFDKCSYSGRERQAATNSF